ncbi:MAG TPA: MarR family transcriptional regulator [Candidatus Avipropionibacterium avicola]|uniref:MarR family transcriptional regulator n=1 Tax=Candidatus Avipropionibacterium avicola TaxID=2840701 RepID=A0A9D1KML4_9ACTN|nr:MarR family transcriptional regulator [Candidatus Avipropionibacterium avicola]
MPETAIDLTTDLMIACSRFTRRVRETSHPDQSPAVWRALSIIAEHEPVRVTELARIDRLRQPTATAMVNRLTAEGLVERSADPDDGRAWLISLSPQGHDRLVALREHASRRLAPAIRALPADQRATLAAASDILNRLVGTELPTATEQERPQ